ncbi:hypothetical protein ZHS_102 [Edwardsiella phage vB_EpM_ZHS]|jgi:hypothetical protein|nr:hypothetical protein ZHS_102 [Edwardsiella phage vB_EpM_ZHS]
MKRIVGNVLLFPFLLIFWVLVLVIWALLWPFAED